METRLTESSRFDVSPQGGRLYWKQEILGIIPR